MEMVFSVFRFWTLLSWHSPSITSYIRTMSSPGIYVTLLIFFFVEPPLSPLLLVLLKWLRYPWSQPDRPSSGGHDHRLQLFWYQCFFSALIPTSVLYFLLFFCTPLLLMMFKSVTWSKRWVTVNVEGLILQSHRILTSLSVCCCCLLKMHYLSCMLMHAHT